MNAFKVYVCAEEARAIFG